MYEQERQAAREIVRDVCTLTDRVQDEIAATGQALAKNDRSPVTVADLAVQTVVSRRLAAEFPHDPLLAEEDAGLLQSQPDIAERVLTEVRRHLSDMTLNQVLATLDRADHGGGGRYWVLDPIDGTKGFLRGDQYAIALALVENGRVVVGVLGCPKLSLSSGSGRGGVLVAATRDAGATVEHLHELTELPARVDAITDTRRAVLCESVEAAHAAHSVQASIARRLGIAAEPYRIDSQCKYAVVAAGQASIYLRLPRDPSYREKSWDHAAGSIVVEEAGGRVTDLDGRPLDFSQGQLLANSRGIVCTNGALHDKVLAACRAELGL